MNKLIVQIYPPSSVANAPASPRGEAFLRYPNVGVSFIGVPLLCLKYHCIFKAVSKISFALAVRLPLGGEENCKQFVALATDAGDISALC